MKKVDVKVSKDQSESLEFQLLRARDSIAIGKLKIENHFELVEEFDGKLFINDCNAVDLNACMASIEQQIGKMFGIKRVPQMNRDLNKLKNLVAKKVKAMLCFGEGIESIVNSFSNELELFVKIDNIEEGLRFANKYAQKGDTILFSPGAPNYMYFESSTDWNKEFNAAFFKLRNSI